MHLHIRLIKSLDALLRLKQLFDRNFNCGLACRNREKLDEIFVSGKPLLDNFDLFANIVPQFEPYIVEGGCLSTDGHTIMLMCYRLKVAA